MSHTYSVIGMTCGGCAKSVTSALKNLKADAEVSVDLDGKTVTVDGLDETQVKTAVQGAGFEYKGKV